MTSDDQTDSYDPLVAERFAVLDRLTPPPAPAVSAEAITAMAEIAPGLPLPDAPVLEPRPVPGPDRWRRPAVLGAAAAVLVVAGLTVGLVASRDGGQGADQVQAGPAADGVDSSVSTTATAGDVATIAPDDAEDTDTGAGADSGSENESAEPITVEVPDGDDGDAASSTSTTVVATSTTATTSASTASTDGDEDGVDAIPLDSTTIPTGPTGSNVDPGNEGEVVTVAGVVSEVLRDCQSWMVLNEEGEAEHRGGVSCDGGSFIVIDGRRIQTSSGFVAADQTFDKHPAELQPGKFVVATAINGPYGGLTLNCDRCGIGR